MRNDRHPYLSILDNPQPHFLAPCVQFPINTRLPPDIHRTRRPVLEPPHVLSPPFTGTLRELFDHLHAKQGAQWSMDDRTAVRT